MAFIFKKMLGYNQVSEASLEV